MARISQPRGDLGKYHSRQTEGQVQVCSGGSEVGMFQKRETFGEASAQPPRREGTTVGGAGRVQGPPGGGL